LAEWAKDAFDYMAMGNFPYPSSYLMNGASTLPAFPVRVACSYMADQDDLLFNHPNTTTTDATRLLTALRDSIGVYYNSTHSSDNLCYDLNPPNQESTMDSNYWDYLYCTEMCMPFDTNGVTDMFWPAKHNWTAVAIGCQEDWNVNLTPQRIEWANTVYGGRRALATASNIIFSNGNLDPWSAYGVTNTKISTITSSSTTGNNNNNRTTRKDQDEHSYVDEQEREREQQERERRGIYVMEVDQGAHHLDLMFSHPLDPPSVQHVRARELDVIRGWIQSRKP
jgi:lysosomal Pro-X carboxypeptidase